MEVAWDLSQAWVRMGTLAMSELVRDLWHP